MTNRPIEVRNRDKEPNDRPIEITPRRARGGREGFPILYVLVGSCALVIIAFVIIYFFSYAGHHSFHAT